MNVTRQVERTTAGWQALRSWFDNEVPPASADTVGGIDALRVASFLILHLGCLAVFIVGWSPWAVTAAVGLYLLRAFFVTAFYHRYFSHRAFRTSRAFQAVAAVLGNSAIQRGPLWWAAHHRFHHRFADDADDPHSPHQHGWYWSHMGWLTDRQNYRTRIELVPDLARYAELRWLDRFDTLVPMLYGAALWLGGTLLARYAPQLGTNGPQLFVWGFFVSTVLLFHVTCLVNSVAHLYGRRRFATRDGSRNNLLVAILALGEGWHNNHHHYPIAARQGFAWWEIDVTYYLLRLLAWTGLIWELRPVPERILIDVKRRG